MLASRSGTRWERLGRVVFADRATRGSRGPSDGPDLHVAAAGARSRVAPLAAVFARKGVAALLAAVEPLLTDARGGPADRVRTATIPEAANPFGARPMDARAPHVLHAPKQGRRVPDEGIRGRRFVRRPNARCALHRRRGLALPSRDAAGRRRAGNRTGSWRRRGPRAVGRRARRRRLGRRTDRHAVRRDAARPNRDPTGGAHLGHSLTRPGRDPRDSRRKGARGRRRGDARAGTDLDDANGGHDRALPGRRWRGSTQWLPWRDAGRRTVRSRRGPVLHVAAPSARSHQAPRLRGVDRQRSMAVLAAVEPAIRSAPAQIAERMIDERHGRDDACLDHQQTGEQRIHWDGNVSERARGVKDPPRVCGVPPQATPPTRASAASP
jgi:hypothetical protein